MSENYSEISEDSEFIKEILRDVKKPAKEFFTVKCSCCKNRYSLVKCHYKGGNPVCPNCGGF